jgi:hypothetical protein
MEELSNGPKVLARRASAQVFVFEDSGQAEPRVAMLDLPAGIEFGSGAPVLLPCLQFVQSCPFPEHRVPADSQSREWKSDGMSKGRVDCRLRTDPPGQARARGEWRAKIRATRPWQSFC